MAQETAVKLRENTPDAYSYRLPGDSASLRHQVTRDRKLPTYGGQNPTVRGTVKVTQDVAIKDAAGNLLRVQPMLVTVEVSIPSESEQTLFVKVLNEAVNTAISQAGELYAGYLPGDSFTITVP